MVKGILVGISALAIAVPGRGQGLAVFQEGVNGYSGGKTVNISDGGLGTGGNANGTTYADGKNDWCIGLLHGRTGFGYDISPLIRFDNLSLPAGATVVSATLTLYVTNWETPARLIGRYLKADWDAEVQDPDGGVTGAPVGWVTRKAGASWAAAGASGEGTDLFAGKQFVVPASGEIPASGRAPYTVELDPAIVQGWIADPNGNGGLKLQVDRSDVHISFTQAQRPAAAERPRLTITYAGPAAIRPLPEGRSGILPAPAGSPAPGRRYAVNGRARAPGRGWDFLLPFRAP